MKLNAKTEYACLAMLQLADEHTLGQPSSIRCLAERQLIPDGFLVQILQDLRRAGLVKSSRGATGGYRLARDPAEISLGDVVAALDGDERLSSNLPNPTPLAEELVSELDEARNAWRARLEAVSLAQLASRAAKSGAPMWYI